MKGLDGLAGLIRQIELLSKTVSIDNDKRIAYIRDNYFGTNLLEAYYTLKGYKVKFV